MAIAEVIPSVTQNGSKVADPGSRNRNIHMHCHSEPARTSTLTENWLSGWMMRVAIMAMAQSRSGLRLEVRSSGAPNLPSEVAAASGGTDIEGQAGVDQLGLLTIVLENCNGTLRRLE